MTSSMTRRAFLASSAVCAGALPALARATTDTARRLTATSRVLDVDGRPATVYGLAGPDGRLGLVLEPGERFTCTLENQLDVETLIHWHGQIPQNAQDGVPDMPMPKLRPGERRDYDFEPLAGTYWMHAHIPVQEMQLLAAPLIVHSPEDIVADRQEVVMFLHDFSFTPPEELLAGLMTGAGKSREDQQMAGMAHGETAASGDMAIDLNDIEFDAYLANDRTLGDPEVVAVERGGRVLLRVINAAAATVFFIDTGALVAELVAVDGHGVQPVAGDRFGVAMGQRLDLLLTLPPETGAFPILALREGARERTGIVLASAGAAVQRFSPMAETAAPPFDAGLELDLRAVRSLPQRSADRSTMVMLDGTMSPYRWTIDGESFAERTPLAAKQGERVELTLHNLSMMAHPMHLHGHVFQVVEIGGKRFEGARRDTVHVPPMTPMTIAFDAGEAAEWMFHCHHMPHLASGMMTSLVVST